MQISFTGLTPHKQPKTPQGRGGYVTPYRGEGVYRGGMRPPFMVGGVQRSNDLPLCCDSPKRVMS